MSDGAAKGRAMSGEPDFRKARGALKGVGEEVSAEVLIRRARGDCDCASKERELAALRAMKARAEEIDRDTEFWNNDPKEIMDYVLRDKCACCFPGDTDASDARLLNMDPLIQSGHVQRTECPICGAERHGASDAKRRGE